MAEGRRGKQADFREESPLKETPGFWSLPLSLWTPEGRHSYILGIKPPPSGRGRVVWWHTYFTAETRASCLPRLPGETNILFTQAPWLRISISNTKSMLHLIPSPYWITPAEKSGRYCLKTQNQKKTIEIKMVSRPEFTDWQSCTVILPREVLFSLRRAAAVFHLSLLPTWKEKPHNLGFLHKNPHF